MKKKKKRGAPQYGNQVDSAVTTVTGAVVRELVYLPSYLVVTATHHTTPHTLPRLWVTMAEVERMDENIANEVRAGAVVSTTSHAVQEREDAPRTPL